MICGDGETARDAVHDAFVNAVQARASYRGEGTVEAWVWRTVVNSARKHQGNPHFVALAEAPEPLAHSSNGGHGSESDDGFRLAVSLLPERQRPVLFLRYYADLDYRAIAAALDIRPGTVAATLNAARLDAGDADQCSCDLGDHPQARAKRCLHPMPSLCRRQPGKIDDGYYRTASS